MNVVNVTAAPYNCDPSGVSDSTAGIIAAVAYANSIGGARVVFPGIFLVSRSMVFSSFNNITCEGDGIGLSSILASSAGTFTNGLFTYSGGENLRHRGLTFNVNNMPMGTLTPAVYFGAVTGLEVSDCEVAHMSVIGIGTSVCNDIDILRNKVSLDVAFNSQNNGILVSGASKNVRANSNEVCNTNILVVAADCWIKDNQVSNYKYGAGIGTTGNVPGGSGPYFVTGNTCTGGTGVDTDGTYVAGMEINGIGGVYSGNVCANNSGVGIASFTYGSVINGNTCYNNGTGGSPLHCAGISGAYQSAGQFFGNNVVTGNTCFDSGSGTQKYGYQDAGDTRCNNNTFSGNNFEHNVTSPFSMASSNSVQGASYEGKLAYVGGSLPNQSSATFNVPVTGANAGDFALGSLDSYAGAASISAKCIGGNTVAITISNLTGASITFPAGNFRATAIQHHT